MTKLEKYRNHIDRIDRQLIDLLRERFIYSNEIGKIKQREGISVLQSDRWEEILFSRKDYGVKAGLSEDFTVDFLQLIHQESIRIQKDFMES